MPLHFVGSMGRYFSLTLSDESFLDLPHWGVLIWALLRQSAFSCVCCYCFFFLFAKACVATGFFILFTNAVLLPASSACLQMRVLPPALLLACECVCWYWLFPLVCDSVCYYLLLLLVCEGVLLPASYSCLQGCLLSRKCSGIDTFSEFYSRKMVFKYIITII